MGSHSDDRSVLWGAHCILWRCRMYYLPDSRLQSIWPLGSGISSSANGILANGGNRLLRWNHWCISLTAKLRGTWGLGVPGCSDNLDGGVVSHFLSLPNG